jgi:hypothetical protein
MTPHNAALAPLTGSPSRRVMEVVRGCSWTVHEGMGVTGRLLVGLTLDPNGRTRYGPA